MRTFLKIILTIFIVQFTSGISYTFSVAKAQGKDLGLLVVMPLILTIVGIYAVWRYIPSSKKTIENNSTDNQEKPKITSYFDSVLNLRKDGFYFLKDDIFINVICFLENGEVSFFSQIELQMGKSIGELFFVEKDIKQQIYNQSTWSEYSCIEGIAKKAYFEDKGKRTIITCKLKKNGQIQVYKQNFDLDKETSKEWADYDFQKFNFQ